MGIIITDNVYYKVCDVLNPLKTTLIRIVIKPKNKSLYRCGNAIRDVVHHVIDSFLFQRSICADKYIRNKKQILYGLLIQTNYCNINVESEAAGSLKKCRSYIYRLNSNKQEHTR